LYGDEDDPTLVPRTRRVATSVSFSDREYTPPDEAARTSSRPAERDLVAKIISTRYIRCRPTRIRPLSHTVHQFRLLTPFVTHEPTPQVVAYFSTSWILDESTRDVEAAGQYVKVLFLWQSVSAYANGVSPTDKTDEYRGCYCESVLSLELLLTSRNGKVPNLCGEQNLAYVVCIGGLLQA